jgi:hypothetical protein
MGKNDLDIKSVLASMLSASKEVLKKEWKHMAPVAELQLKNIVHNLEQIAALKWKNNRRAGKAPFNDIKRIF